MTSLRLGVDLDGVVADFNAGWIDRYNRDFGTDLRIEQVVRWESPLELTHFGDMRAFWSWARRGPASVFRHLPLYDGAVDTLCALAADHEVVIVSAKPRWAVDDTLDWLAEHAIPCAETHFTVDKPSVPCDVYLDDAAHNLTALTERRPEATVCRMVRPWNDPVAGAVDVRSWEEFAETVDMTAAEGASSDAPTTPLGSADRPLPRNRIVIRRPS